MSEMPRIVTPPSSLAIHDSHDIRSLVERALLNEPVTDMHTHLFAPEFGTFNLWGIDELLTYHYLVAEYFRVSSMPEDAFWRLDKPAQADAIWQTLFVDHTPLSEACCGVMTAMTELGLDPNAPDLTDARRWFASRNVNQHIDQVLDAAGVEQVVMTNDPLDPHERAIWLAGTRPDSRFAAVLRLDPLINFWPVAVTQLRADGYEVTEDLSSKTITELRRFLERWIAIMQPRYMAVSLPDTFAYPAADSRTALLDQVVLPTCLDHGLPFAVMIGVRRQVNPALQLAGDGVGKANIQALEQLCARNPRNRFLATMLSRENQHELCVAARKFRNLMPFGCWWFVNNPSLIHEITRMRLEMLGTSFIPQHSDARVLEQVLYKWKHSRRIIADALAESYESLARAGRTIAEDMITRDVQLLLRGNFQQFTPGG